MKNTDKPDHLIEKQTYRDFHRTSWLSRIDEVFLANLWLVQHKHPLRILHHLKENCTCQTLSMIRVIVNLNQVVRTIVFLRE